MLITEHITVTDGGTMLAAFAGCGIMMAVLLLYVRNRKLWWWNSVNGMSCCDENCPPVSLRPVPPPPVPSSSTTGPSNHKFVKTYSFDVADSSSESEMGTSRTKRETPAPSGEILTPFFSPKQDLISLVEKGRVGMSSNSSCCSSTTSSVGEKHAESSTSRIVAHVNDNTIRTRLDLKETKIDNQGIEYQKSQTSPTLEAVDANTNTDCIVVMNTETEERSDLMSCVGSDPGVTQHNAGSSSTVSKCGHLEIALQYDAPMRKMTVHVLQARDLPSRDRGQPTHTQVRLILLPSKKQKHKTKIRAVKIHSIWTVSFYIE
ncbi:hypothetical protein WA026_011848 [Henosepilachna vigintioctopunctata]|uniref:C2 domain-containing protein n=1 Tax=Henosepilachna vigintioctopunctata TaxID=420089 RepID=A0AAW1UJC1_9CUCU